MNKEQMNKYAYELMIKNNPEEAIKNLMLLDRLQERIDKAITYINMCWSTEDIDGYTSYDLSKEEVEYLLEILKGDSNE